MPDPTRKTVSASEMSSLLGVNKHMTYWMLYKKFTTDEKFESEDNTRTIWGKKLQKLIIDQVSDDYGFKVEHHDQSVYLRHRNLGCTPDGVVYHTNHGKSSLEVKCVFDYQSWMQNWEGGKYVPREYEIQIQQQMLVQGHSWGLIAVWVCSDMYYFERKPNFELWSRMEQAADRFFAQCSGRLPPPNPDGEVIEIPWLNKLFPIYKGTVLDLESERDHVKTAEDLRMYVDMRAQEEFAVKTYEPIKARLLAIAGNNSKVELPFGFSYEVQKWGKGKRINPYIPEKMRDRKFELKTNLEAG